MSRLFICLFLCALFHTVQANSPRWVPGEVFQGSPHPAPKTTLKAGIRGLVASHTVELLPPSSRELVPLVEPSNPPRLGFGRPISRAEQWIRGDVLTWVRHPGGGRLAVFSVRSPGAGALRLQLDLDTLPPGAELRFYDPFDAARVGGPVTTEDPAAGPDYWSPTVGGDTTAVEIFLPPGQESGDLALKLSRVSHLVTDPARPTRWRKDHDNIVGRAASCHVDVQCRDVPAAIADSVAMMAWTTPDGFTAYCSGTLLADTDPDTQIPYFLTNHHCGVSDPESVANTEFFWFLQSSVCGGTEPQDRVESTSGGAVLLSSASQYEGNDHAFLRLRQMPPEGVRFSGWSIDPPSQLPQLVGNATVMGVHHPMGDLKKVSIGTFIGYSAVFPDPNPNNYDYEFEGVGVGSYLTVLWQDGLIEGGSSGSGLWLMDNPQGPLLVGSLLGGPRENICSLENPFAHYGRFDLTYKAARFWLVGSADYSTIWQDPAKSGQGVQLLQNGDRIHGAWYTYDCSGEPTWFTFVGDIANNSASAPLLRFSGPDDTCPSTTGEILLVFNSPTSVTFNYTVGGITGSLALEPFASLSAAGYTGVWWDPATSGQGAQLVEDGNEKGLGGTRLSGALYLYDESGRAQWLTFADTLPPGDAPLTTALLRFTGPGLAETWDNARVQPTIAGQLTLTRLSSTSLRLEYTADGQQGVYNLEPFNP